jgi:hypothetical protein
MAKQRLKITLCGKFPSGPKTFGLHTYEYDGFQFVLRDDPKTEIPRKLTAYSGTQTETEYWVCENQVFRVLGAHLVPGEELLLQLQHAALKEQKKHDRIRRELQAFHNSKRVKTHRERIPHHVRRYVWRRDEGKCVQCHSREKLEYDHIIPVSKGGGNTDRNIQLLCQNCNRQKGPMI